MASLQILNPIFSSFSIFPGKSDFKKKILSFNTCRSFKCLHSQRCRIYCATQEGDSKSNEELPESLFMEELKRRGITSTTLDAKKTNIGLNEDIKIGEERPSFSTRNVVSTQYEKSLYNQSMELNSEGLALEGQGLVPRPKLLLKQLAVSDLRSFMTEIRQHLNTWTGGPYELLENERVSQAAPAPRFN